MFLVTFVIYTWADCVGENAERRLFVAVGFVVVVVVFNGGGGEVLSRMRSIIISASFHSAGILLSSKCHLTFLLYI